jgi:hypothetical protein
MILGIFLFRPFVNRFLKGCFVSWGIMRHGTGVPQSLWREERERIAAGQNFLFPKSSPITPFFPLTPACKPQGHDLWMKESNRFLHMIIF